MSGSTMATQRRGCVAGEGLVGGDRDGGFSSLGEDLEEEFAADADARRTFPQVVPRFFIFLCGAYAQNSKKRRESYRESMVAASRCWTTAPGSGSPRVD